MNAKLKRTRWALHFVAVAVVLLTAGTAMAQVAGYSEYFLPGDELNMYYIFNDLDVNGASTDMHSVTSVVAWSAATTVYYDHWENGYGFDPANPGSTSDETYTLATQGAGLTFESANVPSGTGPPNPRNPAATCAGQTTPLGGATPGLRCYDGGDRIFAAGGPVTVTRAVWINARGQGNQADAWEIYPVTPQLTTYVVPFGENNYDGPSPDPDFFRGFQRVYALVQATDDNTTFTVDVDANGTADILNLNRDATWNNAGDGTTVTLQRGQAFLLDRISACNNQVTCTTAGTNSLNSGTIITGDKTLQVKFVAGRTATTFTARGLSAFPRGFWTDDYYAPFGQAQDGTRPTDYYLFNPHATALTVNWQGTATAGSFSIPAGTTQSFNLATVGNNPAVPVGSGLYFSANRPFWGVGFGDSTNDLYEWGYSLLPTTFLYKEHFLGWSPGSLPLTTAPTDGNGIYLTVAQDNTVVFVDYGPNDGVADQTYTLDRLEEQFIPPGASGTLEGARFWATGDFSMAYGENADNANTPTPNLDLGYVALPGTDFLSLVLSVAKSANPAVVPAAAGSATTFTISTKTNLYPLDGVTVIDTLPPNWQYVANSAVVTRPDLSQIVFNSVPTSSNPTITGTGTVANPFVLSWSTAQTGGNMLPNQEVLITFQAQTMIAFTAGTLSQNRVRSTGTRTIGSPSVTQTFNATDFAYVATGDVQISKTSNATVPLYPGDTFTYTVTVTNPAAAGTNLLTGVSLYDVTPAGLSNVAGTTSLSRSTVADSFNTNAYNLNVGTNNWATDWTEVGDDGTATGDDFQVVAGELRLGNDDDVEPTITRTVNLTGATQARLSFRYRTSGTLDATDDFLVQADQNNAGAFTTLATITDDVAGTVTVSYDLTPFIGATTAIRFTFPNGDYTAGDEFIFIDDLSVTYNVADTGPNPPDLVTGSFLYSLVGGQTLVATYNVIVDNPYTTGSPSVTNTAATTSVQIPLQITASKTDIVTTPSVLSATVAGRLWLDADADGTQDIGEPGLDNVLVTLKDQFGTPIATTFTDSNGRFLFTGVAPANGYYVESTTPPNPGGFPSGLTQSFPNGFTNNRSTTFNLAAGQNYTQADLGYRATPTTSAFGDQVWVDTDADQVRDPGEIGLSGATLRLYRDANANGVLDIGTDTLLGTTTSVADGSYLFTGITPAAGGTDDYFVTTTTPGGYTATTPTQVTFLNVVPGNSYLSADYGFLPSGASFTISDRVWFDANANGLFAAETGIGGVTMELLDAADNVIATTTTAADGTFSFSGLPGGGADYTTRISDASNLLADYYPTTTHATARQRLESNLVANVNRTAAPSYGFNLTRSIGDTIFLDVNGNSTQDAGDTGFAGVTVSLYSDTDNDGRIDVGEPLVGTVVTDVNGQYLFTGLSTTVAAGRYVVSIPAPTGYNYMGAVRPDSDPVTAGVQLAANISGGGAVLDRDFAFQAVTARTVSGIFWNDANANGVMNGGEGRFANVSVEILSSVAGTGTVAVTNNSNTVTGTGTTFTNLAPGDPIVVGGVAYRIQSIASNTSLTLTEIYAGATASGLAWTTRGTPLFTTLTNATGDYSFTGLASASYFVRVTDTNGVLTGFGATWERTELLISLSNPADSIELVNASAGNVAGVNFGFALLNNIPTAVKLRVYDAVQQGANVTITWQTTWETRNLGFNVYRDVAGIRTKVNKDLIGGSAFLARGVTPRSGYAYRISDVLSSPSQLAQYWVEDVETTGRKNLNGPLTPVIKPRSTSFEPGVMSAGIQKDSPPLGQIEGDGVVLESDAGIGVLRPTTLPAPTGPQTTRQLELAAASALKVFVPREGWYRISKSEMVTAGFDPGTNPNKIALFCQGTEQPIVVNTAVPNDFQSADTIEFYALGLDTPATGARTYWLRTGTADGLRLSTAPSSGSSSTGSVPFTYQRIDRNFFVAQILDTGDGENFFGLVVTPSPNTESLTVANHDVSAGNATLEVTIRGVTENIEHQVRVELNGNELGIATFNDLQQATVSYPISHSLLTAGANTLRLTALNLTAPSGSNDISIVVSARLTYQHLLQADNGLLEVSLPASQQFTVGGFPDSSIRALDISDPMAPAALAVTVGPDGGNFAATFATPSAGSPRTIVVFSSNRILAAPALALNLASTWSNAAAQRADLVIIAHRDFATAAASLKAARIAKGLETEVVDVDDIYDEFNFGVRSPHAIRNFLLASQQWQKAPTHVLLFGDASLDPRGYFGLGLFDFVPTRLIATVYNKTASDGWFADFDNTGIENLAIGRLPVRTASEAALVVAKLVNRDNAPPSGTWAKTAVMVADVPETFPFPTATTALANLLPSKYISTKKMIQFGSPSPKARLLDALNAGSLLVDYVGHGSSELWSQNIFNSTDAGALTNQERMPLLVGMTCLNAVFHDMFTHSLAEALLLSPNGGAIAVWTSSALTEPGPQFAMNQELFRQLFNPVTIGEAIRRAKLVTDDQDVRRSWILLGDPTMRLVP